MPQQIQLRRGDASEWTSADTVLAEGELGIELDTGRFKIGDGSTAWTSLPYAETSTQLNGIIFTGDTASQADSDPGPGFLRWNHATQSSATEIYISDANVDAVDVSALLDAMGIDGTLYLQQSDDPTKWQLWQVNSVTPASDYYQLAVTLLAYGAAMGSGKALLCDFDVGGATSMDFPDTSGTVGYLNIPQNSQSGNYTTVAADAGKHLLHPSGGGAGDTFTIDSNANVPYALGTAITFVNLDTEDVDIAITDDTLIWAQDGSTGTRTLAEAGIATALKVTSTSWLISGTGLS